MMDDVYAVYIHSVGDAAVMRLRAFDDVRGETYTAASNRASVYYNGAVGPYGVVHIRQFITNTEFIRNHTSLPKNRWIRVSRCLFKKLCRQKVILLPHDMR